MISKKRQVLFIIGCFILATITGCHGTKSNLAYKENPYDNVIMPKIELTDITFLETVDRLVYIHKKLVHEHMESQNSHDSSGGFPGLHSIVKDLPKEIWKKKKSFQFDGTTMAEAFEDVANKFGIKVLYEDGAFASGYVIFEDPFYIPEPEPISGSSDDPFAEISK